MSNEITPVAIQTQPATASPAQASTEAAQAVKPEQAKQGEQAPVASATPAPEQGKKLDTVA